MNLKIGSTVQFNKKVEDYEPNFDEGMKAKIIDIIPDSAINLIQIVFDFTPFDQHNEPLMQANFYDTDRKPTLKWNQMPSYTERNKESIFVATNLRNLPFEVVEDAPVTTKSIPADKAIFKGTYNGKPVKFTLQNITGNRVGVPVIYFEGEYISIHIIKDLVVEYCD
jgi:hypothetical protein